MKDLIDKAKLGEPYIRTKDHKNISKYGLGLGTFIGKTLLEKNSYDAIYTCGPELMMYKTVQMANKKGIFVQASLERMMKCGVGICGSCCVNDDLACRDGTVFDGDHLSQKSEFGHSHRTKSGILEEI